jgi:gliding motility-associated lipoprotein GldH
LTRKRNQNSKEGQIRNSKKEEETVIVEKLKIQMETVMALMQIKNNYVMRNLFLIGIIIMFISCDNITVFEEYKSFENQEWNTDSLVNFDYSITDTISTYKIILNLRHSVDYEYQNLFLFVNSEASRDTIELLLADKSGRWLGSGVGDIREFTLILIDDKIYPKQESKTVTIEQAMRYGSAEKIINLKFIDAIGIRVVKK